MMELPNTTFIFLTNAMRTDGNTSGPVMTSTNKSSVDLTAGGSSQGASASTTLFTVLLSGMVVSIIVGNCLVVGAVATTRRLQTVTNLYVVSLAAADLLVAFLVLPASIAYHQADRWPFGGSGPVLCQLWLSADILLCTASILNLCCISIDRYMAITRPLDYTARRTRRTASLMILAVWLLSGFIVVPPLLGGSEHTWQNDHCAISTNLGYRLYSSIGSFFGPFLVMIFVYWRIFVVARRRLAALGGPRVSSHIMSTSSAQSTYFYYSPVSRQQRQFRLRSDRASTDAKAIFSNDENGVNKGECGATRRMVWRQIFTFGRKSGLLRLPASSALILGRTTSLPGYAAKQVVQPSPTDKRCKKHVHIQVELERLTEQSKEAVCDRVSPGTPNEVGKPASHPTDLPANVTSPDQLSVKQTLMVDYTLERITNTNTNVNNSKSTANHSSSGDTNGNCVATSTNGQQTTTANKANEKLVRLRVSPASPCKKPESETSCTSRTVCRVFSLHRQSDRLSEPSTTKPGRKADSREEQGSKQGSKQGKQTGRPSSQRWQQWRDKRGALIGKRLATTEINSRSVQPGLDLASPLHQRRMLSRATSAQNSTRPPVHGMTPESCRHNFDQQIRRTKSYSFAIMLTNTATSLPGSNLRRSLSCPIWRTAHIPLQSNQSGEKSGKLQSAYLSLQRCFGSEKKASILGHGIALSSAAKYETLPTKWYRPQSCLATNKLAVSSDVCRSELEGQCNLKTSEFMELHQQPTMRRASVDRTNGRPTSDRQSQATALQHWRFRTDRGRPRLAVTTGVVTTPFPSHRFSRSVRPVASAPSAMADQAFNNNGNNVNMPRYCLTSLKKRQERAAFQRERKTAKTLGFVVGCFSVCWLPFFVTYVAEPFCKSCYPKWLVTSVTWLGYVNSVFNPFIYAFYNQEYAAAFKRLLRLRK